MLITILGNIKSVIDKIDKFLMKKQHNYLIAFKKDKNQIPISFYWQFTFIYLKKYIISYAILKILS